ncbi:MAG TPA: HAD family hydrolase [Candidatus Nitrosotalea sp.]|nr:HAD family hydrolase [Candidatus Nitrosotalea sp.]
MSSPGLSARPALLFDLDGTLVDSVYQNVLAWRQALDIEGIDLSVWRIHRRIGMSGGLFLKALDRELGRNLSHEEAERLRENHAKAYLPLWDQIRPLPGARELLTALTAMGVPWAIATSGSVRTAKGPLALLEIPEGIPVVTRDQVAYAKPNPDLFLAAAQRLRVPPGDCFVVGDSIWDLLAAQRAGAMGIGLLSGGYGSDELVRAGAYRVYEDPGDLLAHLDELGIRAGS